MQAFSITFFGEWGDKSQASTYIYIYVFFASVSIIVLLLFHLATSSKILQLATIGLAAEENPLGVVLGGIL